MRFIIIGRLGDVVTGRIALRNVPSSITREYYLQKHFVG